MTNHDPQSPPAQCGVCLIDRQGQILAADPVISEWLRRSGPNNAKPIALIDDLFAAEDVAEGMRQIFAEQTAWAFDAAMNIAGRAGERVHVELRRMENANGPWALASIHSTASVPARSRDALTGLPDRRAIAEWVESQKHAGAGSTTPFAVLFLDLDDFKLVNDRHGHAVGDRVLVQLAARWLKLIRDGDLVARYGGDEFVLLLRNVATATDVEPIIRRLKSATLEPLELGELQLHVAVTIGVAIAEGSEPSLEELLAAADHDMYARKRSEPK